MQESAGDRLRSRDLLGSSAAPRSVVLAAAAVKLVPILHLFLVYAVCFIPSQMVPVPYLALYHSIGCALREPLTDFRALHPNNGILTFRDTCIIGLSKYCCCFCHLQ